MGTTSNRVVQQEKQEKQKKDELEEYRKFSVMQDLSPPPPIRALK
jgi:hypothetical protein